MVTGLPAVINVSSAWICACAITLSPAKKRMINDALGYLQLPWERFKIWVKCEKLLLIQVGWVCFNNKAKNPTKYIALKFELERTGFIHILLQCSFMKRVWNPSDEKNFISCFGEANKSWVGFMNSKYRAEVCCVLWSMMAGVRLVGRTHTGAGCSEAHGFKQIGVELQVLFCTWGKT